MAQRNKKYIVCNTLFGGGAYLTTRATKTRAGKYRWDKSCREIATVLTEGQARAAVRRYGGRMVQL